jgi:glycosyltransferase involved in cell wall biosynthesis
VVEAMALSRPVVATAIGGSIEQVLDGQTGYLVQPGDPRSMAVALEKLHIRQNSGMFVIRSCIQERH